MVDQDSDSDSLITGPHEPASRATRMLALGTTLLFAVLYVLAIRLRFAEGVGQALLGATAVLALLWWLLARSTDRHVTTRRLSLAAAFVFSVLALFSVAIVDWLASDPFFGGAFARDTELSDWVPSLVLGGVAVAFWSAYVALWLRYRRTDSTGHPDHWGEQWRKP